MGTRNFTLTGYELKQKTFINAMFNVARLGSTIDMVTIKFYLLIS